MDINSVNIEQIVKQVISGLNSTPSFSGDIPKTAKVAMLTQKEKFEIKEYPMPTVGDDDVLVKVEGCGVCGTGCSKSGLSSEKYSFRLVVSCKTQR